MIVPCCLPPQHAHSLMLHYIHHAHPHPPPRAGARYGRIYTKRTHAVWASLPLSVHSHPVCVCCVDPPTPAHPNMFIVHVHSHATAHAARMLSSGCAGGIRARPAASSPPAIRTDARAIALVPWLRSLATAVTVANHALELRGCESLCARARLRAGVGRAGVYAGRGSCVDRAGPALRLDLALPRHSSPFDPDERRPNKHQPAALSSWGLISGAQYFVIASSSVCFILRNFAFAQVLVL